MNSAAQDSSKLSGRDDNKNRRRMTSAPVILSGSEESHAETVIKRRAGAKAGNKGRQNKTNFYELP
ncbi:hypothetical protein IJT93_07970 [bacterium]|nr:hypothetical protein [bacterium]